MPGWCKDENRGEKCKGARAKAPEKILVDTPSRASDNVGNANFVSTITSFKQV